MTQREVSQVEVIGQPEIAKRYGVTLAAVWQWRQRYRPGRRKPWFPEPLDGRVAGAPAFDVAEVEEWMRATGRLKAAG